MSASTLAQLRFLKNAAHLMRLSAPETSAFLMARRAGYAALHQEQQQQQQHQHHNGPVASRPNTTDTQRQYICSCCGHILIPGCNGTVLTIRPGRTTKQKKSTKKGSPKEAKPEDARRTDQVCKATPSRSSHEGIRKVFTCGLCGRDTVIALPPPVPLPRKRKRNETVDEHQAFDSKALTLPGSSHTTPKTALITDTPPTKSSNASSKKRAKNRKAGLLELLEKSRDGGSGSVRSQGLGLSFDDFRRR